MVSGSRLSRVYASLLVSVSLRLAVVPMAATDRNAATESGKSGDNRHDGLAFSRFSEAVSPLNLHGQADPAVVSAAWDQVLGGKDTGSLPAWDYVFAGSHSYKGKSDAESALGVSQHETAVRGERAHGHFANTDALSRGRKVRRNPSDSDALSSSDSAHRKLSDADILSILELLTRTDMDGNTDDDETHVVSEFSGENYFQNDDDEVPSKKAFLKQLNQNEAGERGQPLKLAAVSKNKRRLDLDAYTDYLLAGKEPDITSTMSELPQTILHNDAGAHSSNYDSKTGTPSLTDQGHKYNGAPMEFGRNREVPVEFRIPDSEQIGNLSQQKGQLGFGTTADGSNEETDIVTGPTYSNVKRLGAGLVAYAGRLGRDVEEEVVPTVSRMLAESEKYGQAIHATKDQLENFHHAADLFKRDAYSRHHDKTSEIRTDMDRGLKMRVSEPDSS